MGSDCCKTRDKTEPFFNSQPWDNSRPRASSGPSDRKQPVIEEFLRQLALTSPAIRHPAIFRSVTDRYELLEVLRFLRTALFEIEHAYVALISDLVRDTQRWRIKKPVSIPDLTAALRSKSLFFFETDFDSVPVLVVKGAPTVDTCCVVLRHYFDSVLPQRAHAKDAVTVLLDCAGSAVPDALVLGLFDFFRAHYPERLHRVLLIRANLESLTEEARAKLRPHRRHLLICTAEYKPTLLRFIPPERLLYEYGGLRKFRPDGVSLGRLPTRSEVYASSVLLA